MKYCYVDFEFNHTAEARLHLVSAAAECYDEVGKPTHKVSFWLHSEDAAEWAAAQKFFTYVLVARYSLVSFALEAEARSLLSLFADKAWVKYALNNSIDLYLEYRCLLNHNDALAYGEQYIDGKVIKTSPPVSKWEVRPKGRDEDDDSHHKPQYGLAAACFKLLGVKIDADEKTKMRDIIIRKDAEEIETNREAIQRYNESDIRHLPALLARVKECFKNKSVSEQEWLRGALSRANFAIRTAAMISIGYPVDAAKLNKFNSNVMNILKSAAEACNASAEQAGSAAVFRWDKKFLRYAMNEAAVRAAIDALGKPYWRKTEKGKVSLSKDAFNDWFDSDSYGPLGDVYRYLKTKQSLNGFLPGKSKRGAFKDYLGSDNRVRPHFGIYGSKSARSQPAATGFIPLKAHWMRTFIQAPRGRAIAGVDYSSQEFLIAAILSQDSAMISAYESGDVYLALAKETGLAPKDATKQSHKKERDTCKAFVLGISYDMGPKTLAYRLTGASGDKWTEDDAQGLINTFYSVYPDYKQWKDDTREEYEENGCLELPDGWYMWGDNTNARSVGNFPIQGRGSAIMREAVALCQDAGLSVIYTLHDAIYIEYPAYKTEAIEVLQTCMGQAFENVMRTSGDAYLPIRLDGYSWGYSYGENPPLLIPGVSFSEECPVSKGKSDLERYRKFFT